MPEVLRRTAYDGVEALRRAAPALDRGITVATADLRDRGIPTEKALFANGIGTIEPKQKDIAGVINDKRYEEPLATLDENGRGQLRSASGSGSAAFLPMPTQQDHRIEDSLFRVAVVRMLGGRVAAKAGPDAPRHCALVGKDGTMCGRPLDNGGIHANQCKKGAMSSVATAVSSDGWRAGSRIALGAGCYVVEQAIAAEGEEEDYLDLTLESGGRRLWLDVALLTS